MSVSIACECQDGFGLPHQHMYDGDLSGGRLEWRETGWVAMWVDWRAVARALAEPEREPEIPIPLHDTNNCQLCRRNRVT